MAIYFHQNLVGLTNSEYRFHEIVTNVSYQGNVRPDAEQTKMA